MPLGMELGLGPGDIVLDGDLATPGERGTSSPTFWPMSFVAKRSPISAAAELFFIGPLAASPENLCKSVWKFLLKVANRQTDNKTTTKT